MKYYISILLSFLVSAVSFAGGLSAEAGGQGLVYEHGGLAGFYLGPEAAVSYSFDTDLQGEPLKFITAAGARASFLFDSFSSGNPAANILPAHFVISHGILLDGKVEILLNSGIGLIGYFDPGLAASAAFSFSAGIGVRTFIADNFYLYYDNRWSPGLPYGVFNSSWIISAGAGYKFN